MNLSRGFTFTRGGFIASLPRPADFPRGQRRDLRIASQSREDRTERRRGGPPRRVSQPIPAPASSGATLLAMPPRRLEAPEGPSPPAVRSRHCLPPTWLRSPCPSPSPLTEPWNELHSRKGGQNSPWPPSTV